MIVELPGFQDLIHDSQSTFRVLLDALSRPGTIKQITAELSPPSGSNIACGAACLTLFDLETKVWLQPGLNEEIKNWLLFHTGCSFIEDASQANFAVIWNIWDKNSMPKLSQFKPGTAVYPEDSTTLLIQLESYHGGCVPEKYLVGAGINKQINIPVNLPKIFWQQWQKNHDSYPIGVDAYFFSDNLVIGLPRTSKIINY